MTSRRTALAVLASTPAVAKSLVDSPPNSVEEAHHEHRMEPVEDTHKADATPEYFSVDDFALLSCVTGLIIPRTDTPGAVDAGVPYWIDRRVKVSPHLQEVFKAGFASLNRAGTDLFLKLPQDKQVAILTMHAANKPPDAFFVLLKNMTIDGYYSSREGLVQELGFQGNTFRSSFPGCTHPEHQS